MNLVLTKQKRGVKRKKMAFDEQVTDKKSRTITKEKDYKGRTINVLYVPGGGMMGIVPSVILSRLEQLADLPTASMFQVLSGTSTGAIVTSGLAVRDKDELHKPRNGANQIGRLFKMWGKRFFPEIPGRTKKYVTSDIIRYIEDRTNPAYVDRDSIQWVNDAIDALQEKYTGNARLIKEAERLHKLSSKIKTLKGIRFTDGVDLANIIQKRTLELRNKIAQEHQTTNEDDIDAHLEQYLANARLINQLEKLRRLATRTYVLKGVRLTKKFYIANGTQKKVSDLRKKIAKEHQITDEDDLYLLKQISAVTLDRSATGFLSAGFNRLARYGFKVLRNTTIKDYLYDPSILEQVLRDNIGEERLSDSLPSLYITAYDESRQEPALFYKRSHDFFSKDPETQYDTSEGNEKIWDAVMASAANPFAFPMHKTETGRLCTDQAIVDTPMPCIDDILKHKPENTNLKLIVVGTGFFLHEHDPETEAHGVTRRVFNGRALYALSRYVSGFAKDHIVSHIGEENFVELNPCLSRSDLIEKMKMPTDNLLDASDENVAKIFRVAEDYIRQPEIDEALKKLAVELCENLHALGQLEGAHLRKVYENCDVKMPNIGSVANDNHEPSTINALISKIMPRRLKPF